MKRSKIVFLTLEDVLYFHGNTIAHEGGTAGLRDRGLLESAVMMPQVAVGGRYLHRGISAMAAAYLFHICQAHAFYDGNKRAAVISAIAFLKVNGHTLKTGNRELIALALGVANGTLDKSAVTIWIRRFSKRILVR
ncbi:MAG: type II toxin-antitoxin system death-on-curing family toxin [Phycisphaerales bacterium]|nr:type II toxin-antitoxin system death-on-curing family toxin [Phycisphaerales bacterium]